MEAWMHKHKLNLDELVDDADSRAMGMPRHACPLNGTTASQWELTLARYLTEEVLPTVQYYTSRVSYRTLVWFYGPVDDVQQTLGLYQEMLLTIAAAAHVNYGSHTRGSGASYAEGYVRGLPRRGQPATPQDVSPATVSAASEQAREEYLQKFSLD